MNYSRDGTIKLFGQINFLRVSVRYDSPLISIPSSVSAEFGIAKPFPPLDNYPVELESFEITCIAYDPAGVVVPQKIEFIRTYIYDTERVVMENGRIEFTNRSAGHEIPRLALPSEFVLQRGQKAVIKSNLTYRGSGAPLLTKLSWFNGDKLLKTQEDPSAEALPAFVIQNPGLEDVGNYRCVLGVMLRRLVAYNVTAETTVKRMWCQISKLESVLIPVAPWLEKNEGSKVVNEGQSVELECSARGVALIVEWKIERKTDKTVKTISGCFNASSSDSRYKISTKGSHGQSVMSIKNVKIADTGNYYYCCLPSKCSNIIKKHRCQKFTLLLESAGAKTKASLSVLLGVVAFFALGLNF
ncbi:hypothetical protein P5673_013884 [Acropora cervicornis]|uniref:Ig-like domain-containing protein n=1 Tax=Acropora cervicornis TaxID=6130 RepID=A0AAD9V6U6_ACRCE|nr:hypothetical protein P5673_013884 [Acropora cervicornis]